MARQMKDSGIEWIGEIPETWKTVPLKRLATIQTGNTPPKSDDSAYFSRDGGCMWIKAEDLGSNLPITSTTEYLTPEGIEQGRLFSANTVYVCCIASVGKVGYCEQEASCNQQINGLSFNNAYWKYGYYLTRAQEDEYLLNASGNVMKILNSDKQSRLMCPLPPPDEQHRIAALLDRQCAEIDAVIERTKATIEEYKKLKQAVITEAVTKGVRGARKMKDSGIEWLGIIPDAWDCTKLKQVWISVDSGVSVNAADYPTENDSQYGVLKTSCVSKFVFLPNEHKQVNADEYARVACPVKKDTIIVSRMNTPDLVGACGYVDADYPNLFLPDRLWQISFFPEVSAKFVWYYLNNQMVRAYISSLSTGTSSSMQNISKPQFGGITLAVPPIEEQNEIVHYLDEKCAALDTLIAKKTALLTELETYKKSLIYEYVTGKKVV